MKKPAMKEYQSRAFAYMLKHVYSICALDPGLGKSRLAIELREKLQNNCLIICPGYLMLNWVKEIQKWAPPGVQITVIKSGKQIYEVCDTDYLIVSYDLVQKAENFFEWADMVILDEAHAIKSMKAKRTQFLHKNIFENSLKRVHLLTGTPIKNRVQEFYSLLALCFYNPAVTDSQFLDSYPSEIDFADHFSFRDEHTMQIAGRYVTIVKWHGLQNVEELKTHLRGRYIRIKSSDVLDLPPVSYKSVLISDSPDEKLKAAFHSYFMDDEWENRKGAERRERTGSVLPEHKAAAALMKVPFTVKYVKDLLEEVACCLVYTDHVASAEAIAKEFNVPAITGHMPAVKRGILADEFQAGTGRVLVATIGSMKEGKDLFRSSHIVLNDYPWVPGDLKQVIYRIQRIGQNSHCTVHRILGSPQDEYIADVIDQKVETIEKAT